MTRLVDARLVDAPPRQRDTALTMPLSALITDAHGGEEMDEVLRVPGSEAPKRYAAMFLAAIGVKAVD